MTRKTSWLAVAAAVTFVFSATMTAPASAGSLCSDGWVSPSTGSGTCSWHGGIASGLSYLYPTKPKTKYAVKFASCSKLRKQYPSGLAKSKEAVSEAGFTVKRAYVWKAAYALNGHLDKDKNGLACEVLVPYGTRYRPATLGETMTTDGITVQPLRAFDDYSATLCATNAIMPGCSYSYEGGKAINGVPDATDPNRWVKVDIYARNDTESDRYLDDSMHWLKLIWNSERDSDYSGTWEPFGYLDKTAWANVKLARGESRLVFAYFRVHRSISANDLHLEFYNGNKEWMNPYWRDADLYFKLF